MSTEECSCAGFAPCRYHIGLEKRLTDFCNEYELLAQANQRLEKRVEELQAEIHRKDVLASAIHKLGTQREEHIALLEFGRDNANATMADVNRQFVEAKARIAQLEAELMQCRNATGDEGEAENTLAAVKALREDHDHLEARNAELKHEVLRLKGIFK